jgi:hypothetical protein
MTVKELITELQKHDPDKLVYVCDYSSRSCSAVEAEMVSAYNDHSHITNRKQKPIEVILIEG